MKYKKGDIVQVKKNLRPGIDYGLIKFVSEMKQFCGKSVHIAEVTNENLYMIKEDKGSWYWTDQMFNSTHAGLSDVLNRFMKGAWQ